MNWLLKIVDGPMKGAEIALVEGFRLKVGSGDACDVVLADGSLEPVAFELDVSPETVAFIRGEETKTLAPFEIVEVGTSAIAVGPADGPWEPLRKAPPAAPESARSDETPIPQEQNSETPLPQEQSGESPLSQEQNGKTPLPKIAFLLLGIILLLVLGAAAFWLWQKNARSDEMPASQSQAAQCESQTALARIAADAGLVLSESNGVPVLSGNLRRRTERLAVRSLCLAENPAVRFAVTDDETMRKAAEELLFVVTEGAIEVAAVSNCVVALKGYAPTAVALEKTLRALNADVKGLGGLVADAVRIGGAPPPKNGEAQLVSRSPAPEKKAARAKGTHVEKGERFPIAGILTTPYRSVVLRNGLRLAEGGQIGEAVVEKIEPDRLVLREGAKTFEWRP